MTQVHQVVSVLEASDAVGNEVLRLQRGLRDAGCDSEIFAAHRHDREPAPVRDLDSLAGNGGATLLYHFATASEATPRLAASSQRLVVVYHNVTPAEFFYGIDRTHHDACAHARDDLARLRDRAALAIGHSEFSRRELAAMGFSPTASVPLLLDLSRLDGAAPERRRTALLTVGRIAPNKRIDDLLRLHSALRQGGFPDAELWIAGDGSRLPRYVDGLRALASRLGIEDGVHWLGRVDTSDLARLYRTASLYVSMSEHEGFAASLVEAMHCGLPVLARDAGAVAETAGGAAVLLGHATPAYAAELAAALLSDAALRQEMVDRGRRRAAELDGARSLRRMLELLDIAAP